MPWCEPCDAFYNPNTLHADGTCPRCGAQVADPAAVVTDTDEQPDGVPSPAGDTSGRSPSRSRPGPPRRRRELVAKVPWHFWVGVIAMVIYLGWRSDPGRRLVLLSVGRGHERIPGRPCRYLAAAPLAFAAQYGLWRSLVSVSVWGTEGRRFKSSQPDQIDTCVLAGLLTRLTSVPPLRCGRSGHAGPRHSSAPLHRQRPRSSVSS